jgi:hypothetical protein
MMPEQVARVERWIVANEPLVTPERSQTDHVHRLLGVPATADLLTLGLEGYSRAIALLGARTATIMVALVIPLTDAEAIVPVAPESDDILREASDEPPSLALIHRDALKTIERVEEYRAPARVPRLGSPPDSYCSYRVFRDRESMERGWEFGRCLTVWHVPVQR